MQLPAVQLPALQVLGLTKTFPATRALNNVDLTIQCGEVHALLGENGSGKSTLIKILSGYHEADDGTIRLNGEQLKLSSPQHSYLLGARFVHQDLGLVEGCSVADNLCLVGGFPTRLGTVLDRTARARARDALALAGVEIDPSTMVSTLSPALKTGVAVARALLRDKRSPARLLVLDEPTARLPEEEVELMFSMVRSVAAAGIGILYVTHRLDEIFEIAQNATILRDGNRVASVSVDGLTRSELLRHMFGHTPAKTSRRARLVRTAAAPILSVKALHSEVLHGIDLELLPGEIVGVAGVTGSGREALCASIFGARTRDAGSVEIQQDRVPRNRPDRAMASGAAFIPAERKLTGCFVDLSASENIALPNLSELWAPPLLRVKREVKMATNWFHRLDIRPERNMSAQMASFSGGNQQKILYAKWFQRAPKLFLLDEPTQGVDVAAKAELHKALLAAADGGAGILVSSSDVDELVILCDRVVVLAGGLIVAQFEEENIGVRAISAACLGMVDRRSGVES